MDELIAFLRARLGEDEAAARACIDSSGNLTWFDSLVQASGDHTIRTSPGNRTVARIRLADSGAYDGRTLDPDACAAHIARHDPARVLREVAAKQKRLALMIEAHAEMDKLLADDHAGDVERAMAVGRARAATVAAKIDAEIWSDHPDYRAGWKP